MSETMLTSTGIKLYGRVMTELHLYLGPELRAIIAGANQAAAAEAAREGATADGVRTAVAGFLAGFPAADPEQRVGNNRFLQQQLRDPDARIGRIYSFSYDGHYYDLPRPVLLLVHGEGQAVRPTPAADAPPAPLPTNRTALDASGVMAREWEFSSGDIRYWEYDKGDFSFRMDVESGPLEQILLEMHLRNAAALSSGMDLRNPDPRRR
jgi:hypothetical protein